MNWKHFLAGLCGFAFGVWLCMPRDVVLLPRFEVLVIDPNGIAFPGARVQQLRQDFAVTNTTSVSFATADAYGRAAFPPVRGRTSPLLRTLLCGRRIITLGTHAPCGFRHKISAEVPGAAEATRTEALLPLGSRGRLIQITMRPLTPQP